MGEGGRVSRQKKLESAQLEQLEARDFGHFIWTLILDCHSSTVVDVVDVVDVVEVVWLLRVRV